MKQYLVPVIIYQHKDQTYAWYSQVQSSWVNWCPYKMLKCFQVIFMAYFFHKSDVDVNKLTTVTSQ